MLIELNGKTWTKEDFKNWDYVIKMLDFASDFLAETGGLITEALKQAPRGSNFFSDTQVFESICGGALNAEQDYTVALAGDWDLVSEGTINGMSFEVVDGDKDNASYRSLIGFPADNGELGQFATDQNWWRFHFLRIQGTLAGGTTVSFRNRRIYPFALSKGAPLMPLEFSVFCAVLDKSGDPVFKFNAQEPSVVMPDVVGQWKWLNATRTGFDDGRMIMLEISCTAFSTFDMVFCLPWFSGGTGGVPFCFDEFGKPGSKVL